jgi:hypothetical protein
MLLLLLQMALTLVHVLWEVHSIRQHQLLHSLLRTMCGLWVSVLSIHSAVWWCALLYVWQWAAAGAQGVVGYVLGLQQRGQHSSFLWAPSCRKMQSCLGFRVRTAVESAAVVHSGSSCNGSMRAGFAYASRAISEHVSTACRKVAACRSDRAPAGGSVMHASLLSVCKQLYHQHWCAACQHSMQDSLHCRTAFSRRSCTPRMECCVHHASTAGCFSWLLPHKKQPS